MLEGGENFHAPPFLIGARSLETIPLRLLYDVGQCILWGRALIREA